MSLLVAGSLHLDVVLRAPHLPAPDETVTGRAVDYVFGGKGGNQAVAAARMGADVHFAGRAGRDAFGDMIRATLVDTGVNLAQLQIDPGPSGMSAAIVDDSGDYGAVIVSAANLNIEADAVTIADGTRIVLLQNEIPEAVNLALAARAKTAGAQLWLNAAPARAVPDALLADVDLLVVNRGEAAFYAQEGCDTDMLTTLGADGVAYDGVHHPGFKVDVISTHGAGDMFVGALAAEVNRGKSIVAALPFAQAAAALHVASSLADRPRLDAQMVQAFIADQGRR